MFAFVCPGIKGNCPSGYYEIGEMDNLLHPRGALLQAQALLAQSYGAGHAWFNTCGSTMGVYALLFSCAQPGDLILLSSDCHISAVNACLLAGYRVALVYAGQDETGLPRPLSYAAARRALALYPEAKALFLTSPNYYGVCAEVDNSPSFAATQTRFAHRRRARCAFRVFAAAAAAAPCRGRMGGFRA
ncbi:MAG: hypothetical protein ACLT0Y_06125 [Christensenellales bacterium]